MKLQTFLIATILALPSVAFAEGRTVLSVQIQPAIQSNASAPLGAQRLPFLTVKLSASCDGPIAVNSLKIFHRGAGDSNDISGIYAYSGSVRLTHSAAFSTKDRAAQLSLRRYVVPACDERTLTIVGDVSPTAQASGEHSLEIRSAADIVTNGSSVKILSVASSTTVNASPYNSGSIAVSYRNLLQRLTYGSDRTVARILLEASGKDQEVLSMTLTNDGSARDGDLQNIWAGLSNGKHATAIASKLTGDKISLTFDPPLIIRNHGNVLLTIHADIRASVRRTIRLLVDEAGDVVAREARSRRQ